MTQSTEISTVTGSLDWVIRQFLLLESFTHFWFGKWNEVIWCITQHRMSHCVM